MILTTQLIREMGLKSFSVLEELALGTSVINELLID
jgi:hypothetical protein